MRSDQNLSENDMSDDIETEPGSFRDRNNRVYYVDGAVVRGVSRDALGHWKKVVEEPFFQKLLKQGAVIPTSLLESSAKPAVAVINEGWAGVLNHSRIPFVTYPYEWTFGMLKDAALLHLDILEQAFEAGWALKDATAYNVQWQGTKPTFIDVTSFEPWKEGEPWVGYRQFCMMFLIPLMLKAYQDIDYLPFLRSNLEGIDPVEAVKFFPGTSLLKKGVFTNIYLHAKMQKAFSDGKPSNKSGWSKRIRHSKAMVVGTIQGLQRTVAKLRLQNAPTTWGTYDANHSYDDASYQQKKDFIQKHVEKKHWPQVWDIGCNTGTFSRLCSPHADTVLAIDGDSLAIEKLYQRQKLESKSNILPLIMNLANISPSQGWQGRERKSLEQRGTPDFLLCLALIHHMVISANIPIRDFIAWIRGLNGAVILEFVGPEDEMTQHLLKNKVNQYAEYTQGNFESIVEEMFTIGEKIPLKDGSRMLYYLEPKG